MITFDKIVSKLWKQKGELLNIYDIWSIYDPDFSVSNKKHAREIYKIIYRLKADKTIFPIRNSLYYISYWESADLTQILDSKYWKIVKKLISDETWWKYLIGGKKSLEIHLKDYSIHNKLIVYTKDIQKIITINGDLKVYFKIFKPWKSSKISFNSILEFFSESLIFEWINLRVSNKELSILDSLLLSEKDSWIDDYLLKKFLTKYNKSLSREILWKLIKIRYISSINRLRSISKNNNYDKLYSDCLDIIKVEWANCFLSL